MVSRDQFLNDLRELLSAAEEITMDTDLLEIDGWDSYSAVAFLAMIREKYGIDARPFAVAEAVFVEDLYNIVKT
ncbi:MAG: hypothetical protein IKH76_05755 [Clostridiales bacterium]|nr:hypothetical protein [Clostridiales bacterium]